MPAIDGLKIVASATRRGYAGNRQLTVFIYRFNSLAIRDQLRTIVERTSMT